MNVAIVTGSGGLIGAEAVRFFSKQGFTVVGVDNDMRRVFFGDEASTSWSVNKLQTEIPNYEHHSIDIRDFNSLGRLFSTYSTDIKLVVHSAQPSSSLWAQTIPTSVAHNRCSNAARSSSKLDVQA